MRPIMACPSAAAVCSLSEVLEMDAPPKYYLSAKACAGILRRAEKRGKELPIALRSALEKTAADLIEEAIVEDHVGMGPFCHLRKGAHLGGHVHMGNFGEVKDSYLGAGTKMGHFSYIGNATIGKDVNIGAGTITCNYDGEKKHPTVIGDRVFIGSDTMLVAPLTIEADAKTGAGAVVTHNVAAGEVVVGVPAKPIRKSKTSE